MNIKSIFLFNFFIIYSSLGFSQTLYDVNLEARYELNCNISKVKSSKKTIQTFILLLNKRESIFKNLTIYVKDSLIENGTLKYSNDVNKDLITFRKYYPTLPFEIYRKGQSIDFTNEIGGVLVRYNDVVLFKWNISFEKKTINGIACTKATTTKWGRNWIAYYSPAHPVSFGPYKFHSLPGLIFEVFDEHDDYHFTLYRFKKRKIVAFNSNILSKAKLVSKKNYETIRKNKVLEVTSIKVDGMPDIQKKISQMKIEREKNYNPIELSEL